MKVTVVTPPEQEPLSLAEAKAHLRVDHDADDALITALIPRARLWAEERAGRAFITQTLRLSLDAFPACHGGRIRLPRPTVQSIEEVAYTDSDGAEQTLDGDDYQADLADEPASLYPAYGTVWPATRPVVNAVRIEYVAGYGDEPSDVDPRALQAMLLLIGHWYENREDVLVGTISKSIESAAEALLAQIWHGHLWA